MLKALIFDVDGTLSDTDPVHREAFTAFLEPHGIAVSHELFRAKFSGRTNAAIFAELFPGRDTAELARFADEKEALFRHLAPELPPLAGLLDLLDWAQERGLKLAAVTNGPRINLEHAMEALGIRDRFEVLLAREDVERGKPDPMPYLTALGRLGIEASEAIVFEDSPSGIRSARSAGIFTFGLLTGQPAFTLREAGANATIADFRDPVLWARLEDARLAGVD